MVAREKLHVEPVIHLVDVTHDSALVAWGAFHFRRDHDADRWWLPHDRGGSAPDPETAAVLDREAVARIGDVFE